jgi:hypothetical protein
MDISHRALKIKIKLKYNQNNNINVALKYKFFNRFYAVLLKISTGSYFYFFCINGYYNPSVLMQI